VIRLAAAIYLLSFMCGDLAFPRYFCEEYFVDESDDIAVTTTVTPYRADDGDRSSPDRTAIAQIAAGDPGGDYCLHIVHRPVYVVVVSDVVDAQSVPCAALAPSLTDLAALDHPPRAL
jgi:hypothetical protein